MMYLLSSPFAYNLPMCFKIKTSNLLKEIAELMNE